MDELEELSGLIASIYDAALDPLQWDASLDRAGTFIGGMYGSITWHDSATRDGAVLHAVNMDPYFIQIYLERYVKLNPLFPAMNFLDLDVVYAASDIMPLDEFVRTRFYQEWAKPQGTLDAVGANLERSPTAAAHVSFRLAPADSPASNTARRRLGLLVPHLKRAIAIGHMVEHHVAKAVALSETLDKISASVFLVGPNGHIVYSNAVADELVADGRLLRRVNGVLVASDGRVDKELRDALRLAANGDAALGLRGIEIALAAPANERWLAHVLPLTGGARRAHGRDFEAAAAVFVRTGSLDTPSALATFARRYRLTASELRTLVALLETSGISAIANETGVAPATVKTHLNRLFDKTGVRRQADLVRLVVAHSGGDGFANR